jgi:hypothetical protein
MPERLAELRRQRALIESHLAWLDREIEIASGEKKPALPAPASPVPQPAVATALVAAALKAQSVTPTTVAPTVVDADAEAILEEYRVPTAALQTDVRKGCFLYFAAALLFVAVTVVVLYFLLRTS